jgi:ribosome-binding factor A
MPAPRVRKLNESVRAALAEILVSELQDPRLELATVTSVEVSPDMRYATCS